MKVLLDAHLSPEIARLLVDRGHDAVAVTSRPDLPDNASDARLTDIAAGEGRAVVTSNVKDFRPIAAARMAAGSGHAGLILVASSTPRSRSAIGSLTDAIEAIMQAHPAGLRDSERWL